MPSVTRERRGDRQGPGDAARSALRTRCHFGPAPRHLDQVSRPARPGAYLENHAVLVHRRSRRFRPSHGILERTLGPRLTRGASLLTSAMYRSWKTMRRECLNDGPTGVRTRHRAGQNHAAGPKLVLASRMVVRIRSLLQSPRSWWRPHVSGEQSFFWRASLRCQ